MATMTLKELRNTPSKAVRAVKSGQTVRVTRRGVALFDAVPVARKSGFRQFRERFAAAWAGRKTNVTLDEIVEGARRSRE
ncbi:MAG: hypothetical protein AB1705_10045 [Verrucomicrobiota bacterium]